MRGLAGSLPTTAWLLALPQLISRICHSLSDVQQNVQSILVRLAEDFPQQVGVIEKCLTLLEGLPGSAARSLLLSRCNPIFHSLILILLL